MPKMCRFLCLCVTICSFSLYEIKVKVDVQTIKATEVVGLGSCDWHLFLLQYMTKHDINKKMVFRKKNVVYAIKKNYSGKVVIIIYIYYPQIHR